ncbi:MAG: hypothetical protein K6F68_01105 [Clostridiales bacterium]|nr:hypothetical protein [Clostridiales bacterium]
MNPVTESETTETRTEPSSSEAESHDDVVGTDTPGSEKISDASEETVEEADVPELKMTIDGQEFTVIWEDNESVDALLALASDSPIVVDMSMYGGFEQVGSLGTSLPRNDVQITTQAGDIVLYSGNQIVVFYGSNSWAYTRLGHITDKTPQELKDLLGNGDVEITISMEG